MPTPQTLRFSDMGESAVPDLKANPKETSGASWILFVGTEEAYRERF